LFCSGLAGDPAFTEDQGQSSDQQQYAGRGRDQNEGGTTAPDAGRVVGVDVVP
jgi:hypothetical protein